MSIISESSCGTSKSMNPHSHTLFPRVIHWCLFCHSKFVAVVQSLSCVQFFATPWTAEHQASRSFTISQSLLKLMSIESVRPSNHLILCHPLLLQPSIFPSIRVFQVSQFFALGGQSIGVSASVSVLPMNIQDWFPLVCTGWTFWLSRVFSNTTVQKHQFFGSQRSSQSNSHIHTWLLEKPIALTRQTFVGKVTSLLFNMLSSLVIAFLPRSKHILISWLQSPSAVILEPKKIKSLTVSIVSPSICHEVLGPDAMIFIFWMLSFKPTFSLSSFIKRLFSSLLSAIRVDVICISEVIDITPSNLDSSLCFIKANKHMKRHLTSRIIMEMQIKTTLRYHFISLEWQSSQKQKIRRGCGGIRTFDHCWWLVKWSNCYGKQL